MDRTDFFFAPFFIGLFFIFSPGFSLGFFRPVDFFTISHIIPFSLESNNFLNFLPYFFTDSFRFFPLFFPVFFWVGYFFFSRFVRSDFFLDRTVFSPGFFRSFFSLGSYFFLGRTEFYSRPFFSLRFLYRTFFFLPFFYHSVFGSDFFRPVFFSRFFSSDIFDEL